MMWLCASWSVSTRFGARGKQAAAAAASGHIVSSSRRQRGIPRSAYAYRHVPPCTRGRACECRSTPRSRPRCSPLVSRCASAALLPGAALDAAAYARARVQRLSNSKRKQFQRGIRSRGRVLERCRDLAREVAATTSMKEHVPGDMHSSSTRSVPRAAAARPARAPAGVHPQELLAQTLRALLDRTGVPAAAVVEL